MKKPTEMLGWHFLPADRRVVRRGTLVKVGTVETHKGELQPCKSGLHFSPRPIDALAYAPGPVLREVRVSGEIVMQDDKGVASVRETLWIDDVEPMLRAFARWCALSVADKWAPPPIVLKYLREGAEADRAAARDAAWDATRDAAWDAAWAAARAAAWDAARAAAGAAAGAAARAAARAAAGAAAWAAARAAARDAARDAAGDAQNKTLLRMIGEFREGKRDWVFK